MDSEFVAETCNKDRFLIICDKFKRNKLKKLHCNSDIFLILHTLPSEKSVVTKVTQFYVIMHFAAYIQIMLCDNKYG
jgi:hypothetical protein